MKKHLLALLISTLSFPVFSQKIIENPKFSATTAPYVKITRIELQDTTTVLDFEVEYFPGWWIQVSSSETYIQNSEGGDKHYVTRAEGIELDKRVNTPENGKNIYTLYFPPPGKSVETIDFLEESWKIFDIEIIPQPEKTAFIPEEIQGNWLRTDGSNKWMYGIYDDMIIHESKVWKKILLKKKGRKYSVSMENDGQIENLEIKLKRDKLLISKNGGKAESFSREKTRVANYSIPNDKGFSKPIFHEDTAVYMGYIDGYHPKMGKTGIVHVNHILDAEQKTYLVNINPDGTFYSEIPMIQPQDVYVKLHERGNQSLFLEPGKTLFQYIDLNEFNKPVKNWSDREGKTLFMGESARLNSDLQAMDTISYFNYREVRRKILDLSAEEYKKYILDIYQKENESLDKFLKNNTICKKAEEIKKHVIQFNAYERILSYDMHKESAYRKKHKIPRQQRDIDLEFEERTPEYFGFIHNADLNDPLYLLGGSRYYILVNRLKFLDEVRPANNFFFKALADSISRNNIKVSEAQSKIINTLAENEDFPNFRKIVQTDSAAYYQFMKEHKYLTNSINFKGRELEQMRNMEKYFGLKPGLTTNIMRIQSTTRKMKSTLEPLTDEELTDLKTSIENPFLINYLEKFNTNLIKENQEKLAAFENNTSFVINETPEAEKDELFEKIMEKYKGKLVFVDFWATWCGPCRSGMEKIKPLKEELKDEDIAFVYITNPSSPVDTWNKMIPGISGEHYRLTQDEWNILAAKFKIGGIPHYTMVDKNGKVIREKVYFASSNVELKKLFDEYLE